LEINILKPLDDDVQDIVVIGHHNPSKDMNNLLLKSTGLVYPLAWYILFWNYIINNQAQNNVGAQMQLAI
jgi:hypothetical protein